MKHPARRKLPGKETVAAENGVWELRLYLAGQTPTSVTALANLERICSEHLDGRCRVEVIDLAKTPQLAALDQIIAVPTLLRKLPPPVRKIIGDLSNTERVLLGLGVRYLPLDPHIPDEP